MRDTAGVRVRPLAEGDLDEADPDLPGRVRHLPRGADPEKFFGDADLVRTRWKADPGAGLAAELNGRLAGSNFAANWGSVGFFGPLTIAPEYWNRAIAQRLLDATMELFAAWETRHAGLFTFAQSASTWACIRSTGSGRVPHRRHVQSGESGFPLSSDTSVRDRR